MVGTTTTKHFSKAPPNQIFLFSTKGLPTLVV